MGYSLRAATTAAQKLPDNLDECEELFISRVAWCVHHYDIHPEFVANSDETFVQLLTLLKYALVDSDLCVCWLVGAACRG